MGVISLNAFCLWHTAQTLSDYTEQLASADGRAPLLEELEAFWQKNRSWIALSVSFRELDHVSELIVQLRWANEIGDDAEFLRYRLLLQEAIEELSRTERLSIENLL